MWPRLMPGELLRNKRCVHGGIIMERITGGVSLRYSGGGDPLCSLHREEVLYGGLGSLDI